MYLVIGVYNTKTAHLRIDHKIGVTAYAVNVCIS